MQLISEQLKHLTEIGICLIPVGEVDKVARIKWGAITEPIQLLNLYDLLGKYDTNAVAMICGKPSGNLFVIDFDVKNKKELGNGAFLNLFKESFSWIKNEMQFEQTPSGGNHILYKVVGIPEGIEFKFENKAANRWATEEELLLNPSEKKKCFIEINGNGNICQCYPSPKYTFIEGKIGNVTWEDHLKILSFIKSHNECEKEVKQKINISSDIKSWYVEGHNPFDEFNANDNGEILRDADWILSKNNPDYNMYCKPGSKKDYYIGASFDKKTRMYNIFTSSSDLEVRSYNPSDLLAITKYGGNKSELYHWIVSKGFGKLKRSVELKLIKQSAKFDTPLQQNVSEAARVELEKEKIKVKEKYPNGLFWNIDDSGKIEISQKKLDSVIISLGFRNIIGEGLVILDGWRVRLVEESRIFHTLINYILRIDGFSEVDEVYGIIEKIDESERFEVEKIYNCYSSFINKYSKITIEHLKEFGRIQDGKIVVSSKTESYKFFRNCYVLATKDNINVLEYENLGDRLVLEHLIIDRDFKLINDCSKSLPYQFLSKAIGIDSSLLTILGYLTHDFIDDSMNAIFVGLGSPGCGKNILFNLLNHITSVHVIDGRQIELDKNLLQSYNYQRLLVISDVEEKFKYDFFKNFSSGAASLKKLYKDVVVLKRKKMPKPVILTNFSYKMVEGLERRIVDIEFTDFFSKIKGGVQTHFGLMFPSYDLEDKGNWSVFDWNCFDSLILTSISKFLETGTIVPKELSENSWYKRFHTTYNYLLDFFNEEIEKWLSLYKIKALSFEENHLLWCRSHNIRNIYSSTRYNKALSEYCEYLGIEYRKDATLKDENTIDCKFKTFKKKNIVDIDIDETPEF